MRPIFYDDPVIDELGNVNEFEKVTNQEPIISDAYNPNELYAEGSYAIFNNQMYKSNKQTTGTFIPADWDGVLICEELHSLSQSLTTKSTSITIQDGKISLFKNGNIVTLIFDITLTSSGHINFQIPSDYSPISGVYDFVWDRIKNTNHYLYFYTNGTGKILNGVSGGVLVGTTTYISK